MVSYRRSFIFGCIVAALSVVPEPVFFSLVMEACKMMLALTPTWERISFILGIFTSTLVSSSHAGCQLRKLALVGTRLAF